jgi:hypothetical protein
VVRALVHVQGVQQRQLQKQMHLPRRHGGTEGLVLEASADVFNKNNCSAQL